MKTFVPVIATSILICTTAAYAGAAGEIATVAQHAGFAAAAPNLAQTHMHLHHAVNCLVGPSGSGFDTTNMNPCAKSGNGAIPDENNAATKAKLELAVSIAEAGIASSDDATAKKTPLALPTCSRHSSNFCRHLRHS
jgi:hypothetical protein